MFCKNDSEMSNFLLIGHLNSIDTKIKQIGNAHNIFYGQMKMNPRYNRPIGVLYMKSA